MAGVDPKVGDIVRLKKPHPCGGYLWSVLRCGMDFRLQCCTCGHQVLLSRADLNKRVKEVLPQTLEPQQQYNNERS